MSWFFIQAGAFFAGLSVALGAFAAHALKSKISSEMLGVFEVGVRYQMYHSLALVLLGTLMAYVSVNFFIWAGYSFILGITFFSGSLYILSLSGIRTWGAVTPVGGALFLLGWLFFLIGALNKKGDA